MAGNVRTFTSKDKSGKELSLKFVRPSQSIIAQGDLKFRENFSKAFRAGVLVNAEVTKMLRERGMWDDEKDKEVASTRTEIMDLEDKLESDLSLSNEDGEKLVARIRELRLNLSRLNSVYTNLVDNTCESIGGEARNQFFAANCVVDAKSGARIFKNLEDFLARLDETVALDSYREAVIAGLEEQMDVELPSDLTSHYSENKWLASRKKKEVVVEETAPETAAPVEEEPKSKKKKSV
jgi:hypothetical protein